MSVSAQSLRNALLNGRPRKVQLVSIPGIEEPVYVQEMSVKERDRFDVEILKVKGEDTRARLAVATVVDEEGTLVFTEADIPALSALPSTIIAPLADVAYELNRFAKKDIEDLRKNS